MYSGKLEMKLLHHNNLNVRRVAYRVFFIRNWIYSILAAIVSFLLGLLPTILKAKVYERLNLQVEMPYPDKVIVNIDSYKEIRRARFCYREKETVRWIEECTDFGGILYDVGANIGAVSLLYAANLQSKSGLIDKPSILAFEPLFSTYERLCRNIYSNNWSGAILPFQIPLSDKSGSDIFKITSIEAGSSSNTLPESIDDNLHYQLDMPVIKRTVDEFVFQLGYPAPTFLKIDVDGHDFEVLLGTERVLSEGHIRSVLIEKNNKEKQIRNFMVEHGFEEVALNRHKLDHINLRFDRY
jgi:FkbM family methyltransferase